MTCSAPPLRYAMRVSVFVPPQRAPVMPGFAIDQCSRPPGSSVSSSFAFVATMNLPNGDHEALPYAPSRRLEPSGSTTQGPRVETTSTWPWAGSEKSDGCAFLTPDHLLAADRVAHAADHRAARRR